MATTTSPRAYRVKATMCRHPGTCTRMPILACRRTVGQLRPLAWHPEFRYGLGGALRAPLGPVVAPLVPRCALLPAPTPRMRTRCARLLRAYVPSRRLSHRAFADRTTKVSNVDREQFSRNNSPAGRRTDCHRKGGTQALNRAQRVLMRGWGREGVRSEARAEQRLGPRGRGALP